MIEEKGIVVEDHKKTVLIRAARGTSCDHCASKKACHGGMDNDVLVEANNPVGARVGDNVIFITGTASIIKAGVYLYLVPVLCFIAGVVIGQVSSARLFPGTNPDLVSGLFGASFLAAAFAGLKLYSALANKNRSYMPRVLRVI